MMCTAEHANYHAGALPCMHVHGVKSQHTLTGHHTSRKHTAAGAILSSWQPVYHSTSTHSSTQSKQQSPETIQAYSTPEHLPYTPPPTPDSTIAPAPGAMAVPQHVADLVYHAESTRGTRRKQEDMVSVQPDFLNTLSASSPSAAHHSMWPRLHFAGVFDGHGGDAVSRHCAENMADIIRKQFMSALSKQGVAKMKPAGLSQEASGALQQVVSQVLSDSFAHCDSSISTQDASDSGSTAVCAVLGPQHVWIANLGDSRAVIARGDGQAIALTDDHKPERPDEMERIRAAGGHVFWNGVYRVMGNLAVSRAMGDSDLKQYGVISTPEVVCVPRTAADEFLILASDGLWGSLSNHQAVQLAQSRMSQAHACGNDRSAALAFATQELVEAALQQGSNDNISVVLMDLRPHGNSRNKHMGWRRRRAQAHAPYADMPHQAGWQDGHGYVNGVEQPLPGMMGDHQVRPGSATQGGRGVKSLVKQLQSWIKAVGVQ